MKSQEIPIFSAAFFFPDNTHPVIQNPFVTKPSNALPQRHLHTRYSSEYRDIMTENTSMPTFKLVLVGDGGTGKVRKFSPFSLSTLCCVCEGYDILTVMDLDDFCQETSYR